jgi:CelD/BcsL family acetyltransferase involved in cellulose biosynthesis
MTTDDEIDRQARAIHEVVKACRRALVDLVVEDKAIVVERLTAWVELERRSVEEPIQRPIWTSHPQVWWSSRPGRPRVPSRPSRLLPTRWLKDEMLSLGSRQGSPVG